MTLHSKKSVRLLLVDDTLKHHPDIIHLALSYSVHAPDYEKTACHMVTREMTSAHIQERNPAPRISMLTPRTCMRPLFFATLNFGVGVGVTVRP